MSWVATPRSGEPAAAHVRSSTIADRVLAAVPLASVYIWLCIVYLVEAWKRKTPWLFTDELEFTQLSRSIAATGRAARRGEPHSFDSVYTYLTAPIWLIHDVSSAYAVLKYVDVFMMASVAFPTYFLARMLVGRWPALFAAAAAAAIPSLAYSSYIVFEPLAYPYAALCFLLIAKALVHGVRGRRPSRWLWAAVAASVFAPLVKGELIVIPVAFALALLGAWWSSSRARRRRASWSLADWIGVGVLAAGAAIFVSGVLSSNYNEWQVVTRAYKHRVFVLGDWAVGSLAIGIGVIPLVLGLAALFRSPGESTTRDLRMFRSVAAGAFVAFGVYASVKATYLTTDFATRIEERNLIYLAPLLFVGTAIVLDRRRVYLPAVVAAAAYALYLVVSTPYQLDRQLYSDALGLAILEQGNRYFAWTPHFALILLLAITAATTAAVFALASLRERRAVAIAIAAALGAAVVGWNLTGEIAAAAGTNSAAVGYVSTLRHPFDWVDLATHRRSTLYLAQGVADQNSEWLLEFWNRSIVSVSSIDGTLGGPGPAGSPNVTLRGKLYWTSNPANPGREYDYAVEDWPCIDFAGAYSGHHFYRAGGAYKEWRLVRLTQPNRLRSYCSGLYPDGWSGANDSSYFRFSGPRSGWMRIVVSRRNWGAATGPSPVVVEVGPMRTVDEEPALARTSRRLDLSIDSRQEKVVWLHTSSSRFAVQVVVKRKFVPRKVDPNLSDPRLLGAQVSYAFFATKPARVPCRSSCVLRVR